MSEAAFAVLHVPHSSRVVPAEVRPSLLLSDEALGRELLLMTDAFTDELFAFDDRVARRVVFPVSRLAVDPERFPDDADEPMAARGMGMVYTRTSDGAALRGEVSAAERARLLAAHYEPHHRRLTAAVDDALRAHGVCLVVDCHSFPSRPLPYEPDQAPDRPEICIGTDAFHTPPALRDAAVCLFREAGFSVAVDRPFAGALVPAAHYRREPRVLAVMVEVNRRLYMNERTGERLAAFASFARTLESATLGIIDAARGLRGT